MAQWLTNPTRNHNVARLLGPWSWVAEPNGWRPRLLTSPKYGQCL